MTYRRKVKFTLEIEEEIYEKSNGSILLNDVKKCLFESNNQYRTYFLERIKDNGQRGEYYYLVDANGEKTPFYHEQYINGQWQYVESIPRDAYVKFIGQLQRVD